MDYLSLVVLKDRQDDAFSRLVYWKVSLTMTGTLGLTDLWGSLPPPAHSMIL